jgi:Protein of unknown function (DUF3010)
MRMCGVELSGSEARFAIIDCEGTSWRSIPAAPPKITIKGAFDPESVQTFHVQVQTFIQDHSLDRIAVRKPQTGGIRQAGAPAFVMAGAFQLSTEIPLEFLAARTINARLKSANEISTDGLRRYQEEALRVALASAGVFD